MNKEQLAQDWKRIGIKEGDTIAMHSSLSSLGFVKGGAKTVIESLQQVITPTGNLVMPTHTYTLSTHNEAFHPQKTSCKKGVGIIPDTFWRMKDVKRSLHPTHSAAAWGARAGWIIEHHGPTIFAFEAQTPFHRAALLGGMILLLGVTNKANSSIHVAEALAEAPYLDAAYVHDDDVHYVVQTDEGRIKRYPLTKIAPGCSKNFDVFSDRLIESGIMKKSRIGQANTYLLDSARMMEAVGTWVNQDPTMVLCNHEDCSCCDNRKKSLRQKGFCV